MADPEKIGKYEIVSVLGKGGMGVVYKARDPFIDRIVAIKTIRLTEEMEEEDLGARLAMEAKSAGKLHHPNICTIFDFGKQDNLSFIVLEYAEGGDLSQVIDKKLPLSLPQKIDVIVQIASGLDYAHRMGVVHRDMKPANVRLTKDGTAKIIDFGLARFDTTRLTKTGFMSGTIAYMSPERINGESGESDDIFALGTLSWELLTYERAFSGSAPPEVMFKILSTSPPLPSTIIEAPDELDAIIMRCMAREKTDRYQTAGDFALDLEALVRSPSFQAFLQSDDRSTQFRQSLEDWEEAMSHSGRSSDSRVRRTSGRTRRPGSTSGLTFDTDAKTALGAVHDGETVIGPDDPTRISATNTSDGTVVNPAAEATVVNRDTEPTRANRDVAPTVVESRLPGVDPTIASGSSSSRARAIVITLVVAVLAAAALGIGMSVFSGEETGEPVPAVVDTTGPDAAPPGMEVDELDRAEPQQEDLSELIAWETQRNLAETFRSEISEGSLNTSERARFNEAERLSRLALEEFDQGNARAGVTYMAEAASGFESVSQAYGERKAREEERAAAAREARARPTPPRETTPTRTEPVGRQPDPEPVREVVRPAPPPVAPAGPTPAQLEAEARSFIGDIAGAYSSRDGSFFERRYDGYNETIGRAIRNAPSTNVRIEVLSIDLKGADRATASVRRTDTFSDRNIPPAVQTLTYELRRASDGWHLVSFSR
ncbi:MAG: serine/threonine protein kinase [Acidobacteria bacterium]|nr:serine/threonine protein kinase [Acidobacteriota bacterium]